MANFANLQRTTGLEKSQAKEFAIQKFASDLVNDLDILQLALDAVRAERRSPEAAPEAGTPPKDLIDLWTGVSMTLKTLESTLKRYGVTPFDPTGDKFDPNKHDALFQAEMPGKEAGTVFSCQKKVSS